MGVDPKLGKKKFNIPHVFIILFAIIVLCTILTYVKSGERHYYVWSYREKIGSPMDSGSMLMVGEFNADGDPGGYAYAICFGCRCINKD